MRNRLVAAFVGLTVAVIALYGVPRAFLLADLVETQEQRKIERTVDLVEVVLLDQQDRSSPVTPELLEQLVHTGERLEVVPSQGTAVTTGDVDDPTSGQELTASRALPDGTVITLTRSGELVGDRVARALMPLVLIGLGLVLLSVLAAYWLSQRLARPFQELAGVAQQLGTGDFDLAVSHYPVPEAELIGTALRDSAGRLDALVRREREFTVQASHLLRTPITALRLELEDVSLWRHTPVDVAARLTASIAELDRLSSSITDLLEGSRTRPVDEEDAFDLTAAVHAVVEERTDATPPDGGRVRHAAGAPLPVRLPRDVVGSAVGLLLDHILSGGPGRVTVRTADRRTHVVIRMVRDGAPHPEAPDDDLLTSGRELAASVGGTVVMLVPPDHGLELMLPPAPAST